MHVLGVTQMRRDVDFSFPLVATTTASIARVGSGSSALMAEPRASGTFRWVVRLAFLIFMLLCTPH